MIVSLQKTCFYNLFCNVFINFIKVLVELTFNVGTEISGVIKNVFIRVLKMSKSLMGLERHGGE